MPTVATKPLSAIPVPPGFILLTEDNGEPCLLQVVHIQAARRQRDGKKGVTELYQVETHNGGWNVKEDLQTIANLIIKAKQ